MTGVQDTDSPIQIANRIQTQFQDQLESRVYTGINTFSDQQVRAYFYVTRTDHCVCVSSQCNFSITLESTGTTGAVINVNSTPTWLTITEAQSVAAIMGETFEDINGTAFTSAQIALVLEIVSAQIANIINNNIVLSLYIDSRITDGQRSIFLDKGPIQDFFSPVVRRPMLFALTIDGNNLTPKSNYALNPKYRELTYRFAQDCVDNPEPYDLNNQVIVGYIAGERKIPLAIKQALVEFSSEITINGGTEGFKSIKGGTAAFEIETKQDMILQIVSKLRPYFLPAR